MALEYCVNQATETCFLRLAIGPSPRTIKLPPDYRLTEGRGVTLVDGHDAVLFAYGPVMLHEALIATETLAKQNFSLRVVNLPWLNRVDANWLTDTVSGAPLICVLEDHSPIGGLGDHLLPILVEQMEISRQQFRKFGVEGYPVCGTPVEALRYHGLDGASLAQRILRLSGRA
jgi:transketolase